MFDEPHVVKSLDGKVSIITAKSMFDITNEMRKSNKIYKFLPVNDFEIVSCKELEPKYFCAKGFKNWAYSYDTFLNAKAIFKMLKYDGTVAMVYCENEAAPLFVVNNSANPAIAVAIAPSLAYTSYKQQTGVTKPDTNNNETK